MGHHEEADGFEAEVAGVAEVLDGDVGFGAVGGDAADGGAVVLGDLDVFFDADAGQHEERDFGVLGCVGGDGDEFLFGGFGESVVEGGSAEAVAVGDFDDGDAGVVEGGDDVADFGGGELVAFVVGAVTQGGVGDPDVEISREWHGRVSLRPARLRRAQGLGVDGVEG